MRYATVVEAYARLETTEKRLEMTEMLVDLFRRTPPEEIARLVYLTQGRIAPDYAGVELGLAEKLVLRVLTVATGLDEAEVTSKWKATGDLGLVAEEALTSRKQKSLGAEPLTLAAVFEHLDAIARTSGTGSQERKVNLLADLLADAEPREAKYIVRTVVGKMRLGVADMTILDALAAAFASKDDRGRLERAYNVSSDLGEVASTVATGSPEAVDRIELQLYRPVRAMLCERLGSLQEVVDRLGTCSFEYKYDGLRVQAHVGPQEIRLFSRRLEDITDQFPELTGALRRSFRGHDGILEGEAVPVDPNTGEFLPFQEVSRRRGRKYDVERMVEESPVTLFLFDCLLLDGADLTKRPQSERWSLLERSVQPTDKVEIARRVVTDQAGEAEAFFDEALKVGCEGLVAKAMDSTYEAGARGYQWVKFKRDYAAALSDTVDLVVVGAFAGRGRRGGTYGALLMAAYDKERDAFPTVCKLGSGFDDETLFALPERLKPHRRAERDVRVDSKMQADFWFAPQVVLEVRGAEISLSPVHTLGLGRVRSGAGFAIRFPRFTGRWREDKAAEDATTLEEILGLYRAQERPAKA